MTAYVSKKITEEGWLTGFMARDEVCMKETAAGRLRQELRMKRI